MAESSELPACGYDVLWWIWKTPRGGCEMLEAPQQECCRRTQRRESSSRKRGQVLWGIRVRVYEGLTSFSISWGIRNMPRGSFSTQTLECHWCILFHIHIIELNEMKLYTLKFHNINLHSVTHSLTSQNSREQMFLGQSSLLIVTCLSLVSRVCH